MTIKTTGIRKVLAQQGGLSLESMENPDDEMLKLLANTIWGTPGGMRFRHLDSNEMVPKLRKTMFMGGYLNKKLFAAASFCHRLANLNDHEIDAYYIHHLAFQPHHQVLSKVKTKSKNSREGMRKSWLLDKIEQFFPNPATTYSQGDDPTKLIYYGYIESSNERSLKIARQFGFKPIRTMATISFSRLKPRLSPDVSTLKEEEKDKVLADVRSFYSDHTLFTTDNLFSNNYYVVRKNGEIVAGAQGTRVHWGIKELPGISGKFILRILPILPILSKLFSPKDYAPVVIEAVYYQPGFEKMVFELFESILHRMEATSILLWLDTESTLYRILKNSGRLGLLDKMNSETQVSVFMRFENCSPSEIAVFQNKHFYVSGFDLT